MIALKTHGANAKNEKALHLHFYILILFFCFQFVQLLFWIVLLTSKIVKPPKIAEYKLK